MKGEGGVPVPDPTTYPGLVMAFELAAQGKSAREVAQALNAQGYRTAGTRGNKPFGTASARWVLRNRFYLGYLPDGNGGWIEEGKHKPFIEEEIWNRAEDTRIRNRTSTHNNCPGGKRVWSLTGLTYCSHCHGRIHTQYVYQGEPRLGCYNRQRGFGCLQKSASLSVYEFQLLDFLTTFHIPEDYQERLLEAHRKLEAAYDDQEEQKANLERQLKRVKELYDWGDYTRAEYQSRRDYIVKQLQALAPRPNGVEHLERLARFLADVPAAWDAATQEQRNKLARCLFDEVWVKDKIVVGVKPRLELEPFFRLNYEEYPDQNIEVELPRRVELYLKHGVAVLIAANWAGFRTEAAAWLPAKVSR